MTWARRCWSATRAPISTSTSTSVRTWARAASRVSTASTRPILMTISCSGRRLAPKPEPCSTRNRFRPASSMGNTPIPGASRRRAACSTIRPGRRRRPSPTRTSPPIRCPSTRFPPRSSRRRLISPTRLASPIRPCWRTRSSITRKPATSISSPARLISSRSALRGRRRPTPASSIPRRRRWRASLLCRPASCKRRTRRRRPSSLSSSIRRR